MKDANHKEKLQQKIKIAVIGVLFTAAIVGFGIQMRKNDESVVLTTVSKSEYVSEQSEENESPLQDSDNDFISSQESEDKALKQSKDTEKDPVKDMDEESERKSKEDESVSRDKMYVHVCGAVTAPGVYELPQGSRMYEAVEEAGGMTADAADEYVNLAQVVEDGQQIWIPSIEEIKKYLENGTDISKISTIQKNRISAGVANTAVGVNSGEANVASGKMINLNTASRDELMTLSGIGASRADAILAYREEKGNFQKIEDIMKVPGIKNSAFQKIKDNITV